MRKGFNGLSALGKKALREDPFSAHLFVFRGRRSDQTKVIRFDGQTDATLLTDQSCQIDQPLANRTVDRRDRTLLANIDERLYLARCQLRLGTQCLKIDKTHTTVDVEVQGPVTNDLHIDPAQLRCMGPQADFIDQR